MSTLPQRDLAPKKPIGRIKLNKVVKTEGPILTPEEREKFVNAVSNYHSAKPGSEERLIAIKDSFNYIMKGYRNLKSQDGLTSDDKTFLTSVYSLMKRMVSELMEGCNNSDPHLRWLSFEQLTNLNTNSLKQIVYLAKNSHEPDIREMAVDHIFNEVSKGKSQASSPDSLIMVNGRRMKLSSYYYSMLIDVATTGNFADSRDRVLKHFAESFQYGDISYLRLISDKSKFVDTRSRALKIIKKIEEEKTDVQDIAKNYLDKLFPGTKPPVQSKQQIPQQAESQIYDFQEYAEKRKEEENPKPPSPNSPAIKPDSPVFSERVAQLDNKKRKLG